MWYNEEFLAPFFLNHYSWVHRIHILLDADTNDSTEAIAKQYPNVAIERFSFPDMLDDIIKSAVISAKYRTLTEADYVIVVDSDEFIFTNEIVKPVSTHLAETVKDVYFVSLWQIYKHETDQPLDPDIPVHLQRRHGDPDMENPINIGYIKPIVVKGGIDLFWGIGNHYIVHDGMKLEWLTRHLHAQMALDIAVERPEMLQGAHWRLVDVNETIKRRILNRKQRLSAVNIDRRLGAHYHRIKEDDILKEYDDNKNRPVVLTGEEELER